MDEGEENEDDLMYDFEEQSFQQQEAEENSKKEIEESQSLQKLESQSNEEIFTLILKRFEEKPIDFLDCAFEFVRKNTTFFQPQNISLLKARLDGHMEIYTKENPPKVVEKESVVPPEKPAVSNNPTVEVKKPIQVKKPVPVKQPPQTFGSSKKTLGEDPVNTLKQIILDRLSGEGEAVPLNNLLQSITDEYTVPKETYGKKWKKFLSEQSTLKLQADTDLISVLPEHKTDASKNTQFPIIPDPKQKQRKKKKKSYPFGGVHNGGGRGHPRARGGMPFPQQRPNNTYPYHPYPPYQKSETYPYHGSPQPWLFPPQGRGRGRRGRGHPRRRGR